MGLHFPDSDPPESGIQDFRRRDFLEWVQVQVEGGGRSGEITEWDFGNT